MSIVEVGQISPRSKEYAIALIQLRIGERKIDLVLIDRSAERESLLIVRNARNDIEPPRRPSPIFLPPLCA